MATTMPEWIERLKSHYVSGSSSFFILHGNVEDVIGCENEGRYEVDGLTDFLANRLFGQYDLVLHYDMGRGLRPHPGGDQSRLDSMNRLLERIMGGIQDLGPEPSKAMRLLDRLIELLLVGSIHQPPRKTAFLFDYSQLICPPGDRNAQHLATFLNWARNPIIKKVNMIFILMAPGLGQLHPALVQSGYSTEIRVPMPTFEERKTFVTRRFSDMSSDADRMAKLSAGLTLTNLENLLRLVKKLDNGAAPEEPSAQRTESLPEKTLPPSFMENLVEEEVQDATKVDPDPEKKAATPETQRNKFLVQIKKQLIESQCPGLLEFVEPKLDLNMIAGHSAAKKRLAEDGRLIREGHLEAAPMGYLICGPVGVGKTFIAMCYAGTVGIPCITLKNFRSKYVGETEANLEKILGVLRELGPVAVIIDEADAAVGNRGAQGDSGTSARVFAKLASQMGNTAYRGKIIWFMLTCRPDLLPIDLKRQGRCEEHIPLFYPETPQDLQEMFLAMGRKHRIRITEETLPDLSGLHSLSGADIEGILTRVRREAVLREKPIDATLIAHALKQFRSLRGIEHELQILAAIMECSDRAYLPKSARELIEAEGGIDAVQKKYRQLLAQIS